jgi:hypothetical protein
MTQQGGDKIWEVQRQERNNLMMTGRRGVTGVTYHNPSSRLIRNKRMCSVGRNGGAIKKTEERDRIRIQSR